MALNSLFCADVPLSNYSLTRKMPMLTEKWLKFNCIYNIPPLKLLVESLLLGLPTEKCCRNSNNLHDTKIK